MQSSESRGEGGCPASAQDPPDQMQRALRAQDGGPGGGCCCCLLVPLPPSGGATGPPGLSASYSATEEWQPRTGSLSVLGEAGVA